MKNLLIVLVLIAAYVGGAVSHRLYFGACMADVAKDMRESQTEFLETIAPADEASRVAALRAAIDTVELARALDAAGATAEERDARYGEQLVVRMEDVRQTLNLSGEYVNEYAVANALERAAEMLAEMGMEMQAEPH